MATAYVVNVPVADVWAHPQTGKERERLTQVLMGDLVLMIEEGSWVLGQMPDGYRGYVSRTNLVSASTAYFGQKATVIVAQAAIHLVDDYLSFSEMNVYLGTCLKLVKEETVGHSDKKYVVRLPDGRRGQIASDAVAEQSAPQGKSERAAKALDYALLLLGAPYLWGGITSCGVDCSGLVYVAYRTAGLLLPRDADQQYAFSQPIKGQAAPGDLVFFSTEEPGLPSHVGLYLGQNQFIHASSRLGGVVVTSLNSPFYRKHFLGWRRLST